jgi:hypothetical protein
MKAFQALALGLCMAGVLVSAGAQARPARICPMIYRPVCGVKYGHLKTYGNSCMARAAGARILYPGHCRPRR